MYKYEKYRLRNIKKIDFIILIISKYVDKKRFTFLNRYLFQVFMIFPCEDITFEILSFIIYKDTFVRSNSSQKNCLRRIS